MDPAAMAGGGGMPPMGDQQQPPMAGTPGGGQDIDQIMKDLKEAVAKAIDKNGYIDMNHLITLWPQVSQIPFDTVMQLLEQQPELLDELIAQYGLNGISVNGKTISIDELHSMGQGSSPMPQGGPANG